MLYIEIYQYHIWKNPLPLIELQITDTTMATFAELKDHADFIKLYGQKCSVVSCLNTLKESMKALPTEKPSLRSFNKLEKAIEFYSY